MPAEELTKIKEYEQDIEDLKSLVVLSKRVNNQQYLNTQLDKLKGELLKLKAAEQERLSKLNGQPTTATTQVTGYTKKIDTFGWDQSEKFVKIYITSLGDVSQVKDDDVVKNFAPRSADVTIRNVKNVNYNISFSNLLNEIDPAASYVKVKSDMITIFLKKFDVGRTWSDIVKTATKEKPLPKFDENADPQEGLMSMMKKMYDEGDDEMKRTISKAFSESREKSLKGESGLGMGGMGGMNDLI